MPQFSVAMLLCALVLSTGAGTAEAAPAEKPLLGVRLKVLTPKLRKQKRAPKRGGVLVDGVLPRSPAQRLGLMRGDVIMRIDKRYVYTPRGLLDHLARRRPGQRVRLDIVRNGKWFSGSTTLVRYRRPQQTKPRRVAPPTAAPRATNVELLRRLAALQREIRQLRKMLTRLRNSCGRRTR